VHRMRCPSWGSACCAILPGGFERSRAQAVHEHVEYVLFELRNHLSELTNLGEKLESVRQRVGLSRRCLLKSISRCDERFTNIISYGFQDQSSISSGCTFPRIATRLDRRCWEDDGICLQPDSTHPSRTAVHVGMNARVGGLGIHLGEESDRMKSPTHAAQTRTY